MEISALLSTYNNGETLKETIDSVLNQTFSDFEFIIVNDGSTDNTKYILDSYNDPRIKVIHLDRNLGIASALNIGIEYCTGTYTIKIDGDDISHPQRFEKQLIYMKSNPELALSKCLYRYFSSDKNIERSERFKYNQDFIAKVKNGYKSPAQISEALKWHCAICHSTMIIKTEVLKKYLYNNFPVFEDYDLFYRMNEDGLKMGHLDEELVRVRISNESTTALKNSSVFNEIAWIIKEKKITQFLQNDSIYIWGTGSYGEALFELLTSKGYTTVKGFIDSYKGDCISTFKGKTIFPPECIDLSKKAKVIVASTTGFQDIIEYLKTFGYETDKDFINLR